MWDVGTAGLLHEYEAHSKRIWSVDFCTADPTLLASGSDDCAVKFWSTKCASSVAQVGVCLRGGAWREVACNGYHWPHGLCCSQFTVVCLADSDPDPPYALLPSQAQLGPEPSPSHSPSFPPITQPPYDPTCACRWTLPPTCAPCAGARGPPMNWRWGLQTTACTCTICATHLYPCAPSRATGGGRAGVRSGMPLGGGCKYPLPLSCS